MATTKKTTTKATTTETPALVMVPPIDVRHLTVTVVGDSPLIMHKWSEKAKKEIRDKQMKKATTKGHDIKDPVRDFIDSIYWIAGEPAEKTEEGFRAAIESGDAKFGFPSVAFKAAAASAGFRSGVTQNKVSMYAALHIDDELVEIKGIPAIREDMVRVGGISRAADIRYRAEFDNWSSTFTIKYNAAVISPEQIINLFNLGGFCCGVGEWRIEKGGNFGAFHCC